MEEVGRDDPSKGSALEKLGVLSAGSQDEVGAMKGLMLFPVDRWAVLLDN